MKWQETPFAKFAKKAIQYWPGKSVIQHIADSGNSVYVAHDSSRQPWILRLSYPFYRSVDENIAELHFIDFLANIGLAVSTAILSCNHKLVEVVSCGQEEMYASVFTFAQGKHVKTISSEWNQSFLREWGRYLGTLHTLSSTYETNEREQRWQWKDEFFFKQMTELLPSSEFDVWEEYNSISKIIEELPMDKNLYGMIHADFAPQNFHYSEDHEITAFDFGNCCYHWFANDVAISLSTLGNRPSKNQERTWFLQGYQTQRPLLPIELDSIDAFIRLRAIYVYLSRLWKFGKNPTQQEQKILQQMKARVLEKRGF